MKYIVVVNQKYIVSVEAESELSAEHKILDDIYYGITGAQAFDQKSIKTDCFWGLVLGCETISFDELKKISDQYKEAQEHLEKREQELKEAQNKMKELLAEMELLKNDINICKANRTTSEWNMEQIKKELGTR